MTSVRPELRLKDTAIVLSNLKKYLATAAACLHFQMLGFDFNRNMMIFLEGKSIILCYIVLNYKVIDKGA